jgi:hypothetical protein
LFFLRQRVDLPGSGIEANDAAWAVAFEQEAALHSDLHAAAAWGERCLLEFDDVAPFAIVDGIKGQQVLARDADASLGSFWIVFRIRKRPALRLFVDPRQLVEQFWIDAAKERDRDDLLFVIDGGDPAGEAALANVVAMLLKLILRGESASSFVEIDLGESALGRRASPNRD